MFRVIRSFVFVVLAGTAAAQSSPASNGQTESPNLAGVWVLNPALTQKPAEIGFNPVWARAGGQGGEGSARSGGRGRRGGSSSGGSASGAPALPGESADDSTRKEQLTGDARTPPAQLTIVQKPTSVSIADEQGHSRTFHPDGHLEELTIGTVALPTTARWDAGKLVVLYEVESGRQLRYTYTPNTTQLLVDIRFIEQGREGDEVRLTYERPDAHNRNILSGQPMSTSPPEAPAAMLPGAPHTMPPGSRAAGPPMLPPGSELRGLSTIETVVEDLSAQAAACGLDPTKIKTSIARILADAGFKPQPYGNEDADVLVSVVTSKLPDGACVSRYDASLVAHADATFPYLKGTVTAVEVQLLHEGGMAGGSPAAHASAVMDALAKSVNKFVSQIHAASK